MRVFVVVLVGVLVGVEFAVAVFVNPLLDRLPGDAGLYGRSDGGRVLGRVMPVWYLAATALAVGWAVVDRTPAPAVAAGLLVLTVVLSVTVLVPINDRVRTWAAPATGVAAPADWREQVHRWDRWHVLRVALLVGAFALLAAAL